MAKLSKRIQKIREKVEHKLYPVQEAFALMKEIGLKSFDESVDASIMLGVDPRKSDQVVRGATLLPEGSGRTIRVAVFAQGKNAELAEQAGADIVGFEELAEEIKKGRDDFDLVIATPDTMRVVGQLGQILGPKGIMPNPKVGTVTTNVEQAVQNAKSGQARFRTDKAGIIHCSIGKLSFAPESLQRNLTAVIADLKKLKPATAKGVYFKKIFVSSTMGPGLQVDISTITD